MHNYERVLLLAAIWEASSPIDFVGILGAFYSHPQKTYKYICYLQLNPDIYTPPQMKIRTKRTEERAVLLYATRF